MVDTKKSKQIPVTKAMLESTRDELKSSMVSLSLKTDGKIEQAISVMRAEFRSELRSEIGSLRTEMQSEISGLGSELRSEIGGLRSELHSEVGSLRSEIGDLRSEMHSGFGSLRSEMLEMKSELKGMNASIHRMLTLYENQKAENRYVLDARLVSLSWMENLQ